MPGFQLATRLNAPRHVATPDQALYTSNTTDDYST